MSEGERNPLLNNVGINDDHRSGSMTEVERHLETYKTFLGALLADKILTSDEQEALQDMEQDLGITPLMREQALASLGWTLDDLEEAKEDGEHMEWGDIQMEFVEHKDHEMVFFRRPTLRQYWRNGVLVRERAEHKVAWSELLYDLVFVSCIATLAESLEEGFSFFVFPIFLCIYQNWQLFTVYLNLFGTTDVVHKLYFAVMMILLGGVAANIDNVFVASEEYEATGEAPHACYWRFALAHMLCRTWIFLINVWAVLVYNVGTPESHYLRNYLRIWLITNIIPAYIVSVLPFVCSMFFSRPLIIIILWTVGPLLDSFASFCGVIFLRSFQTRILDALGWEHNGNLYFIAFSIEHVAERTGLFVIIVLGEGINALVFADDCENEFWQYCVSAMVLLIIFSLEWMYFDINDSVRTHAFRRSAFTAVLWRYSHVFYNLGLVVMSAGLALLMHAIAAKTEYDDSGSDGEHHATPARAFWYTCGGVACVLLFSTIIHASHLGKFSGHVFPKWIRLGARLVVIPGLLALPFLGSDWESHETRTIAVIFGVVSCLNILDHIKGRPVLKRFRPSASARGMAKSH
eukprot:CAMPEP_0119155340 /NCGR_PEP_ID=MMETSP1310-20130426/51697_1 /TAXON_ID=464262 /ORGANISM="Genus nov. species nov., Strain RCC2339" /LENGTH=575 /DNA_ID=CAMNT_0007147935 /DNA_START=70 /DNA_END=1797 /DNA_ORIENTATION=-